jgi:hypothetical protein
MGIVSLILGGIETVTELVTATGRLRKAARELERDGGPQPTALPPAPPPLGSGYPEAVAYLRGRDDASAQREEQLRAQEAFDRFARDAAAGDEAEAEKPTEGETQ